MNIELEKTLIKQDVDGVTDEKLFVSPKRLHDSAKQKQELVVFTAAELFDRIVKSREAIHTNKLIVHEEARKYFLL
ncbi:MAG: hypothetical protein KF763_01625 [Cyclobacteriaceae bacterium]|nr:hypothetical protein [Cyclobacteriaceae bacterium]